MSVEQKREKLRQLLRDSLLPKASREWILLHIDKFEEKDIDQMLIGLQREQEELAKLQQALKEFEERKEKEWEQLEQKQKKLADEFVEQQLKELVGGAKKE